jgi:MFS transporter, ACS family, D-galactonate transporter
MQTTIRTDSNFRWVILAMTTLTGFIAMGFQTTSLSALFSEIAISVNLDLVQIGLVWGVSSVMGIFTTVIGGSFVDYFGTRRSLVTLCILIGITGALRGFAVDFWTLFLFSFLYGMVQPLIPMNLVKLNRQWFSSEQLGLAVGIMSAGFATGLMLGARFSATFLSPMLGGWRGVLILMGVLTVILAFVWLVIHPPVEKTEIKRPNVKLIFANIQYVTRYREIWVYAIVRFGILGLMRGVVGYVPTYLREIGWDALDADTAITVFFFVSLVSVVPLSHLSDRIKNRQIVITVGVTLMSIGTGLMFFVGDVFWGVMLAMIIAGCFFDTCMALTSAAIAEVDGLDLTMIGSALGFAYMMQNLSSTIMPPLGNALSTFGLNVPFLLWSFSGLIAVVTLVSYKGNKAK